MSGDMGVRQDWGSAVLPPSQKRTKPLDWAMASVGLGAVSFYLSQALLWRDLPVLGPSPGVLGEHAVHWMKLAANKFTGGFAYEAAAYAAEVARLKAEGLAFGLWSRLGLGFAAAVAPSVAMAPGYLTPHEGQLHVRGARRHEGKAALTALKKKLAPSNKRRPDHRIHPELPYPGDQWTRHMLVVGGVGSGKSTVLRPLLKTIIDADEKLICYDPKGEFTASFKKPAIIAPWDERTFAWDIAKDLRNIGDMRRFAASIVQDSKDPMWSSAARQILVGFLACLRTERGTLWGWKELADLLSTPEEDLLPMMERYNPEALRAVERVSVTTTGILINLAAFCSPIFDLARAWGHLPESRRISFIEWALAEGPKRRQIILQGNGAYADLTRSYVEGIVGTLSALINSVEIDDDPTRKLWIIADELGQMGKIPIKPLFEVGRSRGVRCVVACQDFAQLEEVHGKETVKALVSMSGTLLVGRVGPGETADTLAKALGSRDVERANLAISRNGGGTGGKSTTLSYSRDEVPLYRPSELASRLGEDPARGGVVLALATQGEVYELFWSYASFPATRKAHIPADWTLGLGEAPKLWEPRPKASEKPSGGTGQAFPNEAGVSLRKHGPEKGKSLSLVKPSEASPGSPMEVSARAVKSTKNATASEWGDRLLELSDSLDSLETGLGVESLALAKVADALSDRRPAPAQDVRVRDTAGPRMSM